MKLESTEKFIGIFLLISSLFFAPLPSKAAELIMMEQNGCSWCKRWHEEIGIIYSKTDEGKKAPLRVVNIHQEWPKDLTAVRKERFTPTFVVVEDGVEIGRLRGYTGDEFFWFLLGEILDKIPDNPASGTKS